MDLYRTCIYTENGLTMIIGKDYGKVSMAGIEGDWMDQKHKNDVEVLPCERRDWLPSGKRIWYCADANAYFIASDEHSNKKFSKADGHLENIFFKRYERLLDTGGFFLYWIEPFHQRFGNRYLFISERETFMFVENAPKKPLFCRVARYANDYVGVSVIAKDKNRLALYAGCNKKSITTPQYFSDMRIPEENIELVCYTGWNEKLFVIGTLGKGGYVKIYTKRGNSPFRKRIQFRKGGAKSQYELLSICWSALKYALSKDRNDPNIDPPFSSFKFYG